MATILPPLIIDVRVREPGASGRHFWIPFFLLWPILLLLVLPALAITVLVDFVLIVAGARYHHYTLLLLGLGTLFAQVRGTHARINSKSTLVDFDIY
ncbi:hypothetical protein EG835_10190 [bacterium]|nr:hypothetical protein [bacterium]